MESKRFSNEIRTCTYHHLFFIIRNLIPVNKIFVLLTLSVKIGSNLFHIPPNQLLNDSNDIRNNQVNLCTKFIFLKRKLAGLCPVAMDIYHHFFDDNK
jgi:hypothetical protein